MKYLYFLLSLSFLVGCSNPSEESAPPTPTVVVDQTLLLTDAIKYYEAGDVISTDVVYTPRGVNFGELLKDKKVTKTIKIQNSPLYPDYASSIKIEENDPKIFEVDSSDCGVIKTGGSCLVTISANYTEELFTSTKTARLVLGKIQNVDLFVELFGQLRNVNITSNQYVSTYSISMNKSFSTDYAQHSIQQRIITITNSDPFRYVRNDFVVPQLVGQSPSDFYISSNDCMYPIEPMSSCEIRVLYKKWKSTSVVPDSEIKLPSQSQHYSLKYAQGVTYSPVFSAWGTCSKPNVCDGVGTQNRTITNCIKNGVDSVAAANCSGELSQVCESPSGSRVINVVGGTMSQTCNQGSTDWVGQSVSCSSDYHDSGSLSCLPDIFNATYTSYTPATNPLTQVCSGQTNGTRSVLTCVRDHDGATMPTEKCIDPSPTITFKSPPGTRSIPTASGNGTQGQNCLEGETSWVTTSVTCNENFHRNGNDCVSNVYVPTYSAYSTTSVSTTVCSGTATVTRTITSCRTQHDNLLVANSKCSDPEPSKLISSPSGYQTVTLYNPASPTDAMGTQSQFCASGSSTWTAVNTSCYQFYTQVGDSCEASNIATPYMPNSEDVYSPNSFYSFDVVADSNTTELLAYTDSLCTQQVGSGLSGGNVLWNVSASFPPNNKVGVYVKALNSSTGKESLCTYLFSYMQDTVAPTLNLSVNSGQASTTLPEITLAFSNVSENSDALGNVHVYEDSSCSVEKQMISYESSVQYIPSQSGVNLNLGIQVSDAAGNKSSCMTANLFFGLQVEPLYSVAPNWNDYYLASSGSPGLACTGSEITNSATPLCIHGGDKKIIRLDQTSCDNISLADELSMFNWECKIDSTTSKAYFQSTGLRDNMGLSAMIDTSSDTAPAYIPNRVQLSFSNNAPSYSALTNWYSNNLYYLNTPSVTAPLTTNPATSTTKQLTVAGIYVLRKNTQDSPELYYSKGLYLNANKVALVVMPGVILKSNSNVLNCTNSGIAGGTNNCLVSVGSNTGIRSFTYVEGTFSGPTSDLDTTPIVTNSPRNVYFGTSVGYSIMNKIVSRNASMGVSLETAHNNLIKDVISYNNLNDANSSGITLRNSNYNRLYNINSFFNRYGINLESSSGSKLINISANNNLTHGVRLLSSHNNILNKINSTNNSTNVTLTTSNNNSLVAIHSSSAAGNGIVLETNANRNKLQLINSFNNGSSGLSLGLGTGNIVLNSVLLNNGTNSLSVTSGASQAYLSQLAIFKTNVVGSTDAGIFMDGTSSTTNIKFSGNIWLQDQARNCSVNNVGAFKLGMNATCAPTDLSDFTLVNNGSALDFTNSFAPQTPSPFNYNDITPLAVMPFLSGVTKNYTAIADASMRGNCSSGQCVIFDYSLSVNDFNLKSRTNTVTATNSVDFIQEGASCPIEVQGSNFLTNGACIIANNWNYTHKTQLACEGAGGTWSGLDGDTGSASTTAKRFLKNATEIVDPLAVGYINGGNHDGLCESGEACMYSPNFGAYQGEGRPVRCSYDSNGSSLINISLWGYPGNGK